jgi:transposase
VRTSGIRKAHGVFGLLDCFGGKLCFRGHDGKFTSESYPILLESALGEIDGPVILIRGNASYHTSALLQAFSASHTDRSMVYQLPPRCPDLNPIGPLRRKVK